ncbi:MAG: hypothetical protein EOM53_02100 [Alphaproteobacteria bacterium]|nr:hypothetical protein [Alphaproteobacteria bacterium]
MENKNENLLDKTPSEDTENQDSLTDELLKEEDIIDLGNEKSLKEDEIDESSIFDVSLLNKEEEQKKKSEDDFEYDTDLLEDTPIVKDEMPLPSLNEPLDPSIEEETPISEEIPTDEDLSKEETPTDEETAEDETPVEEDEVSEKTPVEKEAPAEDEAPVDEEPSVDNEAPAEDETPEEDISLDEESILEVPSSKGPIGPPRAHSFEKKDVEGEENPSDILEGAPLQDEEEKEEVISVPKNEVYEVVTPSILNTGTKNGKNTKRRRVVIQTTCPVQNKAPLLAQFSRTFKWYLLFPLAGLGIIFLVGALVLYLSTPHFVNNFMKRQLPNISYTLDSHSYSMLVFKNISDKSKVLKADKIIVSYNLFDIFSRRVQSIEIKNISVPISGISKDYSIYAGELPKILKSLTDKEKGLSISSITFSSSKGLLSLEGTDIPFSFSATGQMKGIPQFHIPFSFKEKNVDVKDGFLTLTQLSDKTNLDFKIKGGNVVLNKKPYNFSGTVQMEIAPNALIKTVTFNFKTEDDFLLKATLYPTLEGEKVYNFEASLKGSYYEKKFFKTKMPFALTASLKNISFSENLDKIYSNSSLLISGENLEYKNMFAKKAQLLLNGLFLCEKKKDCFYTLSQEHVSKIGLTEIFVKTKDAILRTRSSFVSEIEPAKDGKPLFASNGKNLALNGVLKSIALKGEALSFSEKDAFDSLIRGLSFNLIAEDNFVLSSSDFNFANAQISIMNGQFNLSSKGKEKTLMFNAPKIELADKSVLKDPFSLSFSTNTKRNVLFSAQTPYVQMQGNGVIRKDYRSALLNFKTNSITFEKNLEPVLISPEFDFLKKGVSGRVYGTGTVLATSRKIFPKKLSLIVDSGLNFSFENWNFKQLKGNFDFLHLSPLTTSNEQKAFIGQINYDPFTFSNIQMNYEVDGKNGLIKLKDLSLNLKGYPTFLKEGNISYQFVGAPLVLKFKSVEERLMEYFNTEERKLKASELNADFSFQIKNDVLSLLKIELYSAQKISLSLTGKKPSLLNVSDFEFLKDVKFKQVELRPLADKKSFLMSFPEKKDINGRIISIKLPLKLLNDFFRAK